MVNRPVRMYNPTHRYHTTQDHDSIADPDVAWTHTFQGKISELAWWDDTLYAAVGESIVAMDPDGTGTWRYQTDARVSSAPAVVDGLVYVTSTDSTLYALDAARGTKEWGAYGNFGLRATPAVVDGTVYIGGLDNTVYAFDAETGQRHWKFNTDGGVTCPPAVVYNTVYVGSNDSNLYALDGTTGQVRWQFGTNGSVSGAPTVHDGTVYFGSDGGHIYALDAGTGQSRWKYRVRERDLSSSDTKYCSVRSGPAVVDNSVYVLSYDDYIYAFDKSIGSKQWEYELDNGSDSSPIVVGDTLYACGTNLHAIDRATGEKRWDFEVDGSASDCTPVVGDGMLYIGARGMLNDDESTLYALESSSQTKVYTQGGSKASSSTGSEAETRRYTSDQCSKCGADLSQYTDVDFCPSCGSPI